jgi:hypothetical protein
LKIFQQIKKQWKNVYVYSLPDSVKFDAFKHEPIEIQSGEEGGGSILSRQKFGGGGGDH